MKKPPGLTKEQWGKYQRVIKLSLEVSSKSLDAIAEANFQVGELTERHRIIKLLEPYAKHDESCYNGNKVICTFEDCHADDFLYAILLIKEKSK